MPPSHLTREDRVRRLTVAGAVPPAKLQPQSATNSERNLMIRSKVGLKVLGLCAVVLGLMAISASGAQASEWYYKKEGKLLAMGDLLPSVGAAFETGGGSLLLTTKGGTKLKINCTEISVTGKLKEGGKSTEGKAKFGNCETFLNEETKASTKCVPETAGKKLELVTNILLVLVGLHEGVPTAIVEPETGTTLASWSFGEACSVAEFFEVKGELILEDCKGEFSVHKVKHLFQEHKTLHNLTALGVPATLDGSAEYFLTGVGHEGLEWAGLHF